MQSLYTDPEWVAELSGGAPLQGASLLASLHPGVLATLVPSVTERRRFQRLYAVGEEGLQRIALGPSVPDEGSRNSYGDGGTLLAAPLGRWGQIVYHCPNYFL